MNVQAAKMVAAEPDDGTGLPDDPILNNRYRIVSRAPLASFATAATQAFRFEDGQDGALALFARVGDPDLPPRRDDIAALIGFEHRHLMALVDAGPVPISGPGSAHPAIVLELPRGGRLVPSHGANALTEQHVKRRIMRPLLDALTALHEQSLVHRAVHPHNLFYADEGRQRLVLGEGVSSIAGLCQPSSFEPIERAGVSPAGRGRGGPEADVHAFGATILALLMGRLPGDDTSAEDLIDARMEIGSLRALMGDFRCTRPMERLLDGMMSDALDERWTLADVEKWIIGEHVSGVVVPRLLNPTKSFPFAERKLQSTRAVAEAFNRHWSDAAAEIQTGRLEKWLASSREWLVMAESVTILREVWAGGGGKMSTDELISRICTVLDVHGPIRYKGLAVSLDGIGPLLAEAYMEGREELAQKLGSMIAMGLPTAWISANSERRKALAGSTAMFTRIAQYIKKPGLGYGLERCLYELNPTLRCFSPLLAPDVSGDPVALLGALDATGPGLAETTPWTDRHITAYLAAAFHPRSDATLASTIMPDDARSTQTLTGLVLFATAQGRSGMPHLPGLSRAMGPATLDIAATYRGRSTRERVIADVERLLARGDMSAIVTKLTDTDHRDLDLRNFRDAEVSSRRAGAEIAMLQTNAKRRRARSILIGRRIAAWVGGFGMLATVLMILSGMAP